MLSKLESESKEVQAKNKQIQDAMQYEIEFFKKEVARLGSGQKFDKPSSYGEKDPKALEKMINVEMVTPV